MEKPEKQRAESAGGDRTAWLGREDSLGFLFNIRFGPKVPEVPALTGACPSFHGAASS
jgi:hypothetical protein